MLIPGPLSTTEGHERQRAHEEEESIEGMMKSELEGSERTYLCISTHRARRLGVTICLWLHAYLFVQLITIKQ